MAKQPTSGLSISFDMISTKYCTKCEEHKPADKFASSNTCRQCKAKFMRISSAVSKVIPRPDENYHCPICNKKEKELKNRNYLHKSVWVADHDHKTDEFRGWICAKCNAGIGGLNDSIENLKRAIEYLENPTIITEYQREKIKEAADMLYAPDFTEAQKRGHMSRISKVFKQKTRLVNPTNY